MSLGSRFLIRGKAVSTPREPLLFLYPQWSRKNSSASSQQEKRHTATVLSDSWSSGDSSTSTIAKKALEKPTNSSIVTSPKENLGFPRQFTQHATTTAPDLHAPETDSADRGGTQQMIADEAASIGHKPSGAGNTLRPNTSSKEPTQRSRLKPLEKQKRLQIRVRKIQSVVQHDQERRAADLERRKQYQEVQRIRRGADLPDWRTILAKLIDKTPDAGEWLEKPVRVIVSQQEYDVLISGIDDNIWDVMSPHGCSISYRSKGPHAPTNLVLFDLSGPINGVRAAIRDIVTVAKTTLIIPNKPNDRNPKEAAAEYLNVKKDRISNPRILDENRRKKTWDAHPASVKKPEVWTNRSFYNYVGHLTSAQMSNHKHAWIYKEGESHKEVIANLLLGVFTDPELKHALSRRALNAAMEYFVKNNQIFHVRCLFVHMEMIGLRMNTKTFNIMMRGAAKNNDLSNFHTLLNLMLKRNHTPDAQTFIAFMRVFSDFRIKKYIVSAMQKKNLLNHKSTIKQACEEIVSEEFELFLEANKTEREFLDYMDAEYGKKWLTVHSANRVLHALGSRWLISRSWKFVLEMKSRSIEPNNVSLNTILFHCKDMKNMEGAVEIIKNWPNDARRRLPMDETSYHCLFVMAWDLRMYNVARLVWKHACLSASTTAWMRSLVYNSMKVGVGLNMAPTRQQRLQRRQWRQRLYLASNDTNLLQPGKVSLPTPVEAAEKLANTATNLHKELLSAANRISVSKRAIEPKAISNRNSVARMFIRTAGIFISGIADISEHPAQRPGEINTPQTAHGLRSLVDVIRSTLDSVHLFECKRKAAPGPTRLDSIFFIREQLKRDQAMWLEWEAVSDFKTLLSAAYEEDMKWRERDTHEEARKLDWMCERQSGILVRKKENMSETTMWM